MKLFQQNRWLGMFLIVVEICLLFKARGSRRQAADDNRLAPEQENANVRCSALVIPSSFVINEFVSIRVHSWLKP